jgi:tRNA(Ile)-lysidine synthase TilS/MesJ
MLENFNNKIISLIPTNEEVVLAVSGGADSTCMALLFSQVKCFNVKVVIVDHKLREESTREATYVQKYLSEKFNFNFGIYFSNFNYSFYIRFNRLSFSYLGFFHIIVAYRKF